MENRNQQIAEWLSRKSHSAGQSPGALGKVRTDVRPGACEATSPVQSREKKFAEQLYDFSLRI